MGPFSAPDLLNIECVTGFDAPVSGDMPGEVRHYFHLLDELGDGPQPLTHELRVLLGRARIGSCNSGYRPQEGIRCILCAIHSKERLTIPHSLRTYGLAHAIAQCLQLDAEALRSLRAGALLHDIGKLWIPNTVLLKPDGLTAFDWDQVKRHPDIGGRLLREFGLSSEAIVVTRSHHERFDGTGYPDGLRGSDIPLLARLVAIADCFDAMTNYRPYRKAFTPEEASAHILSCAGTVFDPQLVEVFASRPIQDWLSDAAGVIGQ